MKILKPNILVIQRALVEVPKGRTDGQPADPNDPREVQVQFPCFGLFDDINDYILPPGDYATLYATEFDRDGFPRGYALRKKRPRLTVIQEAPPPRTIETFQKEST